MTFAELEEAREEGIGGDEFPHGGNAGPDEDMPESAATDDGKDDGGQIAGMMSKKDRSCRGPGRRKRSADIHARSSLQQRTGGYVTIWATRTSRASMCCGKTGSNSASKEDVDGSERKRDLRMHSRKWRVLRFRQIWQESPTCDEVEQRPTPASQFEVPAGYTKVGFSPEAGRQHTEKFRFRVRGSPSGPRAYARGKNSRGWQRASRVFCTPQTQTARFGCFCEGMPDMVIGLRRLRRDFAATHREETCGNWMSDPPRSGPVVKVHEAVDGKQVTPVPPRSCCRAFHGRSPKQETQKRAEILIPSSREGTVPGSPSHAPPTPVFRKHPI